MTPLSLSAAPAPAGAGVPGRRLIGACGRPEAVAAVRRRLLPLLPPGRVYPAAEEPAARLFLWATHGPAPVQWSVAPDGALAAVDGTVWFIRGQGDATPADPAAAVLALVRAGGAAAIGRLSMDAAVAVWTPQDRTLVLGRDRRGAAPLYYAEVDGAVLWASDLPSLLDAGVARELDDIALDNFLADGFVPAPMTLVKSIRKLNAGFAATVRDGRIASAARVDGPPPRDVADLDAAAATAALHDRLTAATARRAPSGEPVAVLLSSGVDSKMIVAFLARQPGRDPATIRTFTYRYTGYDGGWNEGGPAREAAAHFGTVHREIEFAPGFVADSFERMLQAYGEPFTYGMHSFLLDPVLESGVARVITGAGADGWYRSARERRATAMRDGSPLTARALAAATAAAGVAAAVLAPLPWVNRYAEGLAWRLDEFDWLVRTGIPWRSGASIVPQRLRRRLYRDPSLAARGSAAAAALFAEITAPVAGYRDEVRFPFVHLGCFVAEGAHQWYAACARASGLRFDHPFFDDGMIDLMYRLERSSSSKAELRRLAETVMPPAMANVPKVAQTAPIRQWFRGPLRDFLCDGLARDRLVRHGLFDPRGVERMLSQHLRGDINHEWRLWGLLAVTAWYETVLGAGRP